MRDLKAWDGRPERPEKSGWHWIEDADGLRPLFWRGDNWPECIDRGEWQDGFAVLSARDLSRGSYHGPVAMTPELEALCRSRLLSAGFAVCNPLHEISIPENNAGPAGTT